MYYIASGKVVSFIVSLIKFWGSNIIELYAIIRSRGIDFQGSSKIYETSEIYCPWEFPAYVASNEFWCSQ